MLSENGHGKSPAGLERQTTTMSDAPATIIRTRIYRGRWTPALNEASMALCREPACLSMSGDVIGDCEVLDFFGHSVEVSGAGRKM